MCFSSEVVLWLNKQVVRANKEVGKRTLISNIAIINLKITPIEALHKAVKRDHLQNRK